MVDIDVTKAKGSSRGFLFQVLVMAFLELDRLIVKRAGDRPSKVFIVGEPVR